MPVYFIRVGKRGPVKIGFAKNVRHRRGSMQVSSHLALQVCGIIDGSMREEKALHKRFKHLNLRGEWFKVDKDLLAFMRTLSPLPAIQPKSRVWTKKKREAWLAKGGSTQSKRIGRRGGKMKGENQQIMRNGIVPRKRVIAMLGRLPLAEVARKLGHPFSVSTLYRHYKSSVPTAIESHG